MRTRDIVSSFFWIGVGVVFCIGAIQNGIMLSPGVPGPGCLAFIVGFILIVLSLLVLIPALLPGRDGAQKESVESFFPQKESFRKLFFALLLLCLYAFTLEGLGFFVTTLLFLVLVLRIIEPQRWATILSFSLTTAFLAWALFTVLKVKLPVGFLGI